MNVKNRLFAGMQPWTRWYRFFKVAAVVQFLISMALPLVWSDLDTGVWLLSFALFAFWLSNYALLRIAHHHNPDAKGFSGWVIGMWENLLFLVWLIVLIAIVILMVKVGLFMLG